MNFYEPAGCLQWEHFHPFFILVGMAGNSRPCPRIVSCGGQVSLHLLRKYLRKLEGVSASPSWATPLKLWTSGQNTFFGAEPASLPPHRRQILQRGQCAGALGDILTWFRHATTWVLSPLSLCLVICSRTAEWLGRLTSNDLMSFPSSLLAAPCLQNLPLGF